MRIRRAIIIMMTLNLCLLGYLFANSRMSYSSVPVSSMNKGKVALTFDDGPHPYCTEKLLDGLKERDVKATFFVTGQNAEKYPEIVLREKEEGHLIGNHTYSHLQLTSQNENSFKQELIKTNQIIKNITKDDVMFVRPPYGSWNKAFEEELNMLSVLWNLDPLDWCNHDTDYVVNRVFSQMRKKQQNDMEQDWIILLHDQYETSVDAALQIVDEFQKEGYIFVTVQEILIN